MSHEHICHKVAYHRMQDSDGRHFAVRFNGYNVVAIINKTFVQNWVCGLNITPCKHIYLLLKTLNVLIKPQILYITNYKQFIKCCISHRYKTTKILKNTCTNIMH